ncbi:MAG TPA: hypothetical protein VLK29_09975 [Luteimonas sp.]|nr:hypothetical protein [Luteimonas sp.]
MTHNTADPDRPRADDDAVGADDGTRAPSRMRAIRDAQRAVDPDADDLGDPRDSGLSEEPVDQFDGPSFVDDVRSDGDEDERHDKR